MIYLDTNILVYAFCNNVDNIHQKEQSQKVLESVIKSKSLILSEIVLYAFAFVSNKLKEDRELINDNLKFYQSLSKILRILAVK